MLCAFGDVNFHQIVTFPILEGLFKKSLKNHIMKKILVQATLLMALAVGLTARAQVKTHEVRPFDEVIISPHIEVVFEKADKESVVIESLDVSEEKLNVEVKGGTLQIYLDDAKAYTKSHKVKYENYKGRQSVYEGTKVIARVYFKEIKEFSLRGDETHKVIGPIEGTSLVLKIYGEPEVYLEKVDVESLQATLYGEGYLEIKTGRAEEQRIVSYGESEVNTLGVNNKSARVTSYGEGEVRLAVSDQLKVTSFGEASVFYKGNPEVDRGIIVGEAKIHPMN